VALKFLPTHLTKDKASRKRFMVEARAASALDHANICTIHEIGESDGGQLYICMAHYSGQSLQDRIKKGPVPTEEALDIFMQTAQGLQAAHEKNIIHRDIKPGNILITDKGEVRIVDFGLARLAGEKLTDSFSTKGTIAYMAPEIIRGMAGDQRSDIWSLGVVLFEMLTGHIPFSGDYPEPMMYSIVNEEPDKLDHYMNNVPSELQAILDNLLKKDPTRRYQDISNVLFDLNNFRQNNHYHSSTISGLVTGTSHLSRIAVLPLINLSHDAEQEWFSDGITDAITTRLAQISRLRTISMTSAMKYKGTTKTPPEIASELGVRYLVDGSILQQGGRIKISARLLHAPYDEYIWARDYERSFENVLLLPPRFLVNDSVHELITLRRPDWLDVFARG